MVSDYTVGNLKVSPGSKVACCGLEEEEWFLWTRVVELLDMFAVVSADGDNLEASSSLSAMIRHGVARQGFHTFFPCLTN